MDKGQDVRQFDFWFLGPWLLYLGTRGDLNPTQRAALQLAGFGTIALNRRNYVKQREEMQATRSQFLIGQDRWRWPAVQTLLFRSDGFTKAGARSWAREHGYRAPKAHKGNDFYRVRQRPTGHFQPGRFRTVPFGRDVRAVMGPLRQEFAGDDLIKNVPVIYTHHPDGFEHVKSTIAKMAQLARAGAHTYPIRHLATEIVKDIPSKQYADEMKAVYVWVRDNIRYRKDPVGIEWIQSPQRTLEERAGDCDDLSTLIASLLEALGHVVEYRTVGPSPRAQRHVGIMAHDSQQNRWISIDPVVEPPATNTQARRDLGRFGYYVEGHSHRWNRDGQMISGIATKADRSLWDGWKADARKTGVILQPANRADRSLWTGARADAHKTGVIVKPPTPADPYKSYGAAGPRIIDERLGQLPLTPFMFPAAAAFPLTAIRIIPRMLPFTTLGQLPLTPFMFPAAAAFPLTAIRTIPAMLPFTTLGQDPMQIAMMAKEAPEYFEAARATFEELEQFVTGLWNALSPESMSATRIQQEQAEERERFKWKFPPGVRYALAWPDFRVEYDRQYRENKARNLPIADMLPHDQGISIPEAIAIWQHIAGKPFSAYLLQALIRAWQVWEPPPGYALPTAPPAAPPPPTAPPTAPPRELPPRRPFIIARAADFAPAAPAAPAAPIAAPIAAPTVAPVTRRPGGPPVPPPWKQPHPRLSNKYPLEARQIFDEAIQRFRIYLPTDAGGVGAIRPSVTFSMGRDLGQDPPGELHSVANVQNLVRKMGGRDDAGNPITVDNIWGPSSRQGLQDVARRNDLLHDPRRPGDYYSSTSRGYPAGQVMIRPQGLIEKLNQISMGAPRVTTLPTTFITPRAPGVPIAPTVTRFFRTARVPVDIAPPAPPTAPVAVRTTEAPVPTEITITRFAPAVPTAAVAPVAIPGVPAAPPAPPVAPPVAPPAAPPAPPTAPPTVPGAPTISPAFWPTARVRPQIARIVTEAPEWRERVAAITPEVPTARRCDIPIMSPTGRVERDADFPSYPRAFRAPAGAIHRDPSGSLKAAGYAEVGQEANNPGLAPVGYNPAGAPQLPPPPVPAGPYPHKAGADDDTLMILFLLWAASRRRT